MGSYTGRISVLPRRREHVSLAPVREMAWSCKTLTLQD